MVIENPDENQWCTVFLASIRRQAGGHGTSEILHGQDFVHENGKGDILRCVSGDLDHNEGCYNPGTYPKYLVDFLASIVFNPKITPKVPGEKMTCINIHAWSFTHTES